MPKISVIIPIYNAEEYLKECLDSVINQTLKDIEIICIDDGSTDNSLQILNEYAKNDTRIKVFKQKNKGAGFERNFALNKANGDFIAFMDSDDKYPNYETLSLLYNKAISNQSLICGGEFSYFMAPDNVPFQEENIWNQEDVKYDGYKLKEEKITNYTDYQFDYGFHRFIYNREFLIKNNIFFPDYKYFEDPPFLVNAMIMAKNFYAINQITYAYRICHNHTKWNTKKTEDLLTGILRNMEYAHKNNLSKLNEYSLTRLNQYYPKVEKYINLKSIQIIKKMKKHNSKVIDFIKEKKIYTYKKILQTIFSIKNSELKTHKIITFFGLKIKL